MPTRITSIVLLLVLTALVVSACKSDLDSKQGDKVTVITTTYPLTFITERIGGSRTTVNQLVKPGVEAHDFEPAPSDVRAISNSDLFIYNHPAFESWALNAATASNNDDGASTVTVQTINLEMAGEDHGGQAHDDSVLDAHVWLNPLEATEQAERILSALIEVDPEGSQTYTRNADALAIEFRALDELIAKRVSNCELDSVVVSHLAFGHMAEKYGFAQIGLAGLSPEFESGPSQLAKVIERIGELGIKHILQEPIVSDRLATTVSAETGTELLTLHPLEVRTKDEASEGVTYIDIMKSNAEALGTAMNCAS
ncbi:MAG: zinc ABC transporter solute-binding protein [Chloroflexi bacterium]|nr:zinc ABC transporter solute-binding protein [Chloroflexota bacterium]MBT5628248.1 zinc ABC transporter solute-binding protein [Chloroflexota bacterium]